MKPSTLEAQPTTEQLATIAATLARDSSKPPETLAKAAMNLWVASDAQIKEREETLFLAKMDRAHSRWKATSGKVPKMFPIAFGEFLRLALPKRRLEDREKIYREFVRLRIRQKRHASADANLTPFSTVLIPSDDDCAAEIGKCRNAGVTHYDFLDQIDGLRAFAGAYKTDSLKRRARVAGLKSGAKKIAARKAKEAAAKNQNNALSRF
jgi:hypothetical protein